MLQLNQKFDVEEELLRTLAELKRGASWAEVVACRLLLEYTPSETLPSLVPALRASLTFNCDDLPTVAANKLGSLGYEAKDSVGDLKARVLTWRKSASLAALEALSKIPTDESLQTFLDIGEIWAKQPSMTPYISDYLVPLFLQHQQNPSPLFFKKLEKALAPAYEHEEANGDHDELVSVRDDFASLQLPPMPTLLRTGHLEDPSLERLHATEGERVERSVVVILDDQPISVKVGIVHVQSVGDRLRPIVTLERQGEGPSGWSDQNTISVISSLIREKFDLPPTETIWLDRYPATPVYHPLLPIPRRVEFTFSETEGVYTSARFEYLPD